MRLIIIFTFLLIGHLSYGQTFLAAYKKHQFSKIKSDNQLDSLRKTEYNKTLIITKKKIKQNKKEQLSLLNKQINQFDTIFKAYEKEKGFNFNLSDSLTIIYQTNIESNLSDFIIWSGKDTISYGELWFVEGLHSAKKIVQYKPFLDPTGDTRGMKVVTSRDSLMTLAANNRFATAHKLSKENRVLDGMSSTIIIAKKTNGQYVINECFLQPFDFVPIWSRE